MGFPEPSWFSFPLDLGAAFLGLEPFHLLAFEFVSAKGAAQGTTNIRLAGPDTNTDAHV
jgi:hypothetical protein